jgi:hypothetical protein
MAADVVKLTEAKTVEGQSLRIDASDGVIQLIDAVLLPR